jgi:hypothetical protein
MALPFLPTVATAWTFKVAVMIVTMIVTTVSCCSEEDREEGGEGEKGHFHLVIFCTEGYYYYQDLRERALLFRSHWFV